MFWNFPKGNHLRSCIIVKSFTTLYRDERTKSKTLRKIPCEGVGGRRLSRQGMPKVVGFNVTACTSAREASEVGAPVQGFSESGRAQEAGPEECKPTPARSKAARSHTHSADDSARCFYTLKRLNWQLHLLPDSPKGKHARNREIR